MRVGEPFTAKSRQKDGSKYVTIRFEVAGECVVVAAGVLVVVERVVMCPRFRELWEKCAGFCKAVDGVL